MVKRDGIRAAGAVLVLLVSAGMLWRTLRSDAAGTGDAATSGPGTEARAKDSAAPVIGLGQLTGDKPPADVGKRDLFAFATPPPPPPTPTPPPTLATLPPEATMPASPTPPPLPPLTNIKYVGTLESQPGIKVAMFLTTDRKEVLTGQVGEIVGNRFKIVHIGLESVDVQQVGAEQTQRLPLKGNR